MNKHLQRPRYTLGVGDVLHDVSVCLMKDNVIVAAVEEERLNRIKHGIAFPTKHYCPDEHGNNIADLVSKLTLDMRTEKFNRLIRYVLDIADIKRGDIDLTVVSTLFDEYPFADDAKLIDHHLAHAASAFYASPFPEAAILVMDGNGNRDERGQIRTAFMGTGRDGEIQTLHRTTGVPAYGDSLITLGNSPGFFYKNITILLGLGDFCEGKTMALSAYGQANPDLNFIRAHVRLEDQGRFFIDNGQIFRRCAALIATAKKTMGKAALFRFYADLALAHQTVLEAIILHCCRYLHEKTGLKSVCLAGGSALNCVANAKIAEQTGFDRVFVQPATGDNGIALGCALYGAHRLLKLARNDAPFYPYLGKKYGFAEIDRASAQYADLVEPVVTTDPDRQVAAWIAAGHVVGWFQGSSEIGPRALGNRSILADPRNPLIKTKLNIAIKRREPFRPFAPAVLEEATGDYFVSVVSSPYMTRVAKLKPEKVAVVPAVLHEDNTARLQTVSKACNPRFYALIAKFGAMTGVPMLLNTSFNGSGQPIVETPAQAIKTAFDLGLDFVVVEHRLFRVERAEKKAPADHGVFSTAG